MTDRNGPEEIWLRSREGQRWLDRAIITQRDFGDDLTIMLSAPSISPNGQQIAYQRNAERPIWPLRIWISLTGGGAPTPLLPPSHEGFQSAPTWSPDGAWIAYTEWKRDQRMLAKVRVGSGEGPVVLRTDGVPNATPHWSPRGDWITWETEQGFMLVSPDGKDNACCPTINGSFTRGRRTGRRFSVSKTPSTCDCGSSASAHERACHECSPTLVRRCRSTIR